MNLALKCVAALLLLVAGCAKPATPPPPPAAEPEALSRTEFTNRIEKYFEYEPFHSGKPSQVRIHLTDLSDGSPIEQATVTLAVRAKGGSDSLVQTASPIGRVSRI